MATPIPPNLPKISGNTATIMKGLLRDQFKLDPAKVSLSSPVLATCAILDNALSTTRLSTPITLDNAGYDAQRMVEQLAQMGAAPQLVQGYDNQLSALKKEIALLNGEEEQLKKRHQELAQKLQVSEKTVLDNLQNGTKPDLSELKSRSIEIESLRTVIDNFKDRREKLLREINNLSKNIGKNISQEQVTQLAQVPTPR